MSNDRDIIDTEPKRRSGVWSAIAYFTGVAVLVAGIYVITDDGGATDTVPAPAATEEESPNTTVVSVEVDAPSYVAGEEPIADAAEIILPSVVHIETDAGLGSGVVYDSSGLIITAAHVVEGQDTVSLRFADGEQVEGTVLGAVGGVDIAVIQVEKDDLVAAVFNTSKPRVGQLAVAVGSPWGLESTVTAGIVSAVDQANCDFGGVCFSRVQTDAAINPGNSGGPLVDRNGQVIGINVSIRTESGANDGVGFAVPSDIVVRHAESIINGTLLETAFLGVEGEASSGDRAGARITVVTPDTGAADAGLEVDDVVIGFAGVEVFGIVDLAAQVRTHQPGDSVELTLIRDGEEITVEVVLGVRPRGSQLLNPSACAATNRGGSWLHTH